MDLMLRDKVAVVTAASKGLGKAVAEVLAQEGVNLAICSRNEKEIIKTAENIKTEYGVEVMPYACDVTNKEDIIAFHKAVIDKYKTCHILFTNAGGPPSGKIENFTGDDFQKAIELNLMSTINLVYAFLPYMKNQKWGRVIASTSTNVKQLLPGYPLSNVSRLSIVGFVKSLAMEVASYNITANVLAPGDFLTDMAKGYIEKAATREGISFDEVLDKVKNTIPTKTIGDPKDYGALAAFLASEQAKYLTGETIMIDGGKYAGVI